MRNLLIINPNTTPGISALLERCGERLVGPATTLRVVTARFGAPYISCEASYAIAGHAVLDAWALLAAGHAPPDAVLIGCFGDPGLLALREAGVAVTGLATAAATEAAQHGDFAIVTGGARWEPMLQRLMRDLGFESSLGGILAVAPTGAQMAQDPEGAQAVLTDACHEAVRRFAAKAIVIGGAGLAGMAEKIQPSVEVPVIDSVEAGIRQAVSLATQTDLAQRTRFEEIRPWLHRP